MRIEGEISNDGMQDGFNIDEKESLIDKDEVMIRRMKNRERQRRYRARKRMREEASIDEHLSFETMGQLQEEVEEYEEEEDDEEEEEELKYNGGYVENFVRRVYCNRDWKKDARRAHLKAQDTSSECLRRKIWPRRRDWKAEARKKKT